MYHLQVVLSFVESQGFDVAILVDGTVVIPGAYRPASDARFGSSNGYYCKHGVYSPDIFSYEVRSEGVRVFRAFN